MSETHVDNVLYIQDSGSCFDTGSATHRLTLYRKTYVGLYVHAELRVAWKIRFIYAR